MVPGRAVESEKSEGSDKEEYSSWTVEVKTGGGSDEDNGSDDEDSEDDAKTM